ncbi:hypothetical protein VCHA50P417_110065 [Vibrio chagasii]|nr:hypothetical protein VCHA35O142_100102 [Vibrio chagasii]CAH6848172.1 hypothetical protein VCHA35O143_10378 [Vibrio chagasii]CAH6910106.1 hypothetical protein VCHA35O135_20599 [Vibrio chagasii]CAH6917239.1 hypothetical protein VCHA50P417_110065 [Vibrio chagasii]CAH6958191.1 hypothetical protein VCHA48P442_110067 [Vibrio chagasii]
MRDVVECLSIKEALSLLWMMNKPSLPEWIRLKISFGKMNVGTENNLKHDKPLVLELKEAPLARSFQYFVRSLRLYLTKVCLGD